MQIVRTNVFVKALKKLGASDDDLQALEEEIAADPQKGDVIPGLGGVRKIRFSLRGKGKRGGGRAIYIAIISRDTIYLLTAYAKAKKSDLTEADKAAIKFLVAELKA